ncbi:hypothetical protein Ae201684P_006260 [Aphanomyces euteiches]|uniref:Crinkler effector protein N-terminal domain-containing protein n=1 Tax=Aphanomyces euteiches TaxID=100861 RepID=A0A6G0XBM1_9STRA|nr:hypothetical protein Ae201684_006629 [Aphanomyces euteiches]KAH9090856.1 hypothetical protein Ae201684P_006260 [Aphanomyces euteiches]
MIGDERVFEVAIEETKAVSYLTKIIKEGHGFSCSEKDLKLYIAKKGEEIKGVMRENGQMKSKYLLKSQEFSFPDKKDAKDGDIHILVDISEKVKNSIRILWYQHKS